jgi:hypothetical protein
MSTRDHPGNFNLWAELARDAGLTADADYLLTLPLFEAAYFQPVLQESTDLYQLDLATGATRRLTHEGDDGWIIPEFTWSPDDGYLFWTEQRFPDGMRVPAPIDVQRQLAQEQELLSHPPTPNPDPNGVNNASIPLEARTRVLRFQLPHPAPAAAKHHAKRRHRRATRRHRHHHRRAASRPRRRAHRAR